MTAPSPGASVHVTIVVPAYNAAATVAETLRSVCEQSAGSWEAIVVNDGSTDDTGSIARSFGERDGRVVVIDQPNGGEAEARNSGVRRARHEWLLFLDADDWIAPHHLLTMTSQLVEDDSLDAVHCGFARVAADGSATVDPYRPPAGDLFPTLALRAAFPVHACIVRRALVEAVGMFDPSLKTSTDWDLWQRVARAGANFGAVPDVLAFYRMTPQSASMNAAQLLSDGLRVLTQGRAPDPRVRRPRPSHAPGPTASIHAQQFYLMTWSAGLMLGQGLDPRPLFHLVGNDRFPALDPSAIAKCIFESAPLPTCQSPRSWPTLLPALRPRLADYFSALEAHSGAHGLAPAAMRSLEWMVLATVPGWEVTGGEATPIRTSVDQASGAPPRGDANPEAEP